MVGALKGSIGNITTEGFLLAEKVNEYFSAVFNREEFSALSVLESYFEGRLFRN